MSTTSGAITFSGFNGIDFSTIINAIMQQANAPLTNLQNQQQTVQNQQSAYSQLGTQVSNLESDTLNLTEFDAFAQVSSTSSDPTVVTTSAGSGAIAGHYDIAVTNTATSQVTTSTNTYTSTSDVAADGGSISFTVGSTTTTPITITTSTTLAQLRDQINAQNSGVVASVVNTGSAYTLLISSRATGAANGFTINNSLTNSGGAAVAFAAGQNATTGNAQNAIDADMKVNGVEIKSASNTLTDAIPGISFTIVKTGAASIDVAPSYTSLEGSINSLVTDYNNLRSFAVSQQTKDSNGNYGPLANDSLLRQINSDINTTLLQASGSGTYQYLSQVGIEMTESGTMSFDQSKFEAAVATDPNGVAALFEGTSRNGLFNTLNTNLENLDATAGLLKTTQDSLTTQLHTYDNQIADEQARLDAYKATLEQQYAAAQQAMTEFQAEAGSLSAANSQNSTLTSSASSVG
jgi:flagellar hook-associated protein 2